MILKHLKNFFNAFSIFILVAIIVVLFHNNYNNSNLKILSKKELRDIIINDDDDYYKTFTNNDLQVRNVNDIEEYKSIIKDSVCIPKSSAINKIKKSVKLADDKIKKLIEDNDGYYDHVDLNKLYNIKWKIGFICNNNYENGLPHTRDDVIVFPLEMVYNYSISTICSTLIHEKVHVYQKTFKKETQEYLEKNNFKKIKTREKSDNIRANPDMDDSVYSDGRMIYAAKYLENPENISDVRLYKNSQIYEHPFEKMAINLSDACH